MKKSLKFVKYALLCVVSLGVMATSFTSCKDYDDDIDDLQKQIDDIKIQIGTGVKEIVAGSAAGTILVTYSDGTSKTVTIPGIGGGTVGGLSIGSDGYFYSDGTKTNYVASAGNPRVSTDGYLEFPKADGTWTKSTYFVGGGAYYVDAGGSYELYIAKQGTTVLDKIVISKGSAGLGKIDILGWITGKGPVSENISIVTDVKTGDFAVNYAWIEKFQQESDYTSGTNAFADKSNYTWKGQTEVVVKNVLNTLGAERKGILVQVSPANADLSSMTLTLENSQNQVLPVVLEKAELLTGLYTKAATSSALYFIPMTYQDKSVTYEKGSTAAPANTNYTALFKPNALYTIVEAATGFRSEYTPWTFTANAINSEEAAVEYLVSGTTQISGAVNAPVAGTSYKIMPNVAYSIDFDETTPIADPTDMVVDYYVEVKDNNEYVQSQFGVVIDLAAGTFTVTRQPDDLTYATFTLTVYKLGVDGKIYVEDIVIYPVRANLSAVLYDGAYTLTDENGFATAANTGVTPTTGQLSATVTMPITPMFDKLAGEPSGISGMTMKERWQNVTYGAKYWKIASLTIGGKAVDGSSYTQSALLGGGTPDIYAWQTMFYNAGSQIIFSKTSTNAGANDDVTGTVPSVLPDGSIKAPNLYDARHLIIKPAYAQANGTAPLFEIGQEYVLTFEFYDATNDAAADKQNYLSSAVVKFTPGLPALDGLFVKEDIYWTSDKSVLNAYYKWPSTWAGTGAIGNWFYGQEDNGTIAANIPWTTGATTSTYYNVYSTSDLNPTHQNGMPYDGGFKRFGQPTSNTDKQWIDAQTTLAFTDADGDGTPDQKFGNANVNTKAAIGTQLAAGAVPSQRTIVELFGQTPTPASGNVYDQELDMSIVPGKYLGVYDYTDYTMYATALRALDFKMKIMSALEKGTITGSTVNGGIPVPAGSAGTIIKIKASDFKAANYNKEPYSVFQTIKAQGGAPVYEYTYIRSVEFYAVDGTTAYNFVDADGDPIASPATAIAPDWTGTDLIEAYVGIKTTNISQLANVKLGIRIIDRFGRTKTAEIPFEIVQQ